MSSFVLEKIVIVLLFDVLFVLSVLLFQFGDYVWFLGLENLGDGGGGNFVKIDFGFVFLYVIYVVSEDGKFIFKLKDGSGVFVCEEFLIDNVVELCWYGVIECFWVVSFKICLVWECNWCVIWVVFCFL